MSARFIIKKDKIGNYRFILKAPNGEIIANSEAYFDKDWCKKGIEAVIKYSIDAKIQDDTREEE